MAAQHAWRGHMPTQASAKTAKRENSPLRILQPVATVALVESTQLQKQPDAPTVVQEHIVSGQNAKIAKRESTKRRRTKLLAKPVRWELTTKILGEAQVSCEEE